jgi:hypothetical protein
MQKCDECGYGMVVVNMKSVTDAKSLMSFMSVTGVNIVTSVISVTNVRV